MILYLDYAATTPVHPDVLEEMVRVYREDFGNAGSRTHSYGQRADDLVLRSRKNIAALLGIETHELIFTSGATESNNLAILGLAAWGAEQGRKHIISTTIEHKAVLEPLSRLSKQGFDVELAPVGRSGRVSGSDILNRVREDTLLVTMLHANNETGVLQPVDEIGSALDSTQVFFHIDAAQTFGKEVENLRQLHYDFLSISAHKVQGPQGIGGLVVRDRDHRRPPLRPIMFGGDQERGLRPGTLPVALVAGFGTAASLVDVHHAEWRKRLESTRRSLIAQMKVIAHSVNGDIRNVIPGCLNIMIHGVDSEALMILLRDELAVSNGAACTSASYEPSHVLRAMGLSDDEIASSIRISWGPDKERIDLTPLIEKVEILTP